MRGSRGRVVVIALGLGIVLIAGAAYLLGSRLAAGTATAAPHPSEPEHTAPGPMYVLKERVANLADAGARRYLKIALSIEFTTKAAEFRRASPEERREKQVEFDKDLAPWVPLIDDAIINLVSSRTSAEVATSEGKQRLKDDIKEAINRRLGGERVANVYFTQFVMQ